jgi:hypothetical protein
MCLFVEVQVLHWPEDARYLIFTESSFKLTKYGMHQPSANSFPPYAIGVCVCMCTYVCAEEDIPVASDIAHQPVGDLFGAPGTCFESPSVGIRAFFTLSGTDMVHIRASVTCIASECIGLIQKMTTCTRDACSSCLIMLLATGATFDAYCLPSQVIVPSGAACFTHRHPLNIGISSHATFTAYNVVTDRKPSCDAVGTGYCSAGLNHLSRVTFQTSGQSILRGKLPQNTVDADTQCGVRSLSCGAVETGRCSDES